MAKLNVKKVGSTLSIEVIDPICSGGSHVDGVKIIEAFKQQLIANLKARQEACFNDFVENQDSIVEHDDFRFTYLRKDGSYGRFNMPTYEVIGKAIDLLRADKFDEFLSNRVYSEQVLKSFFNSHDEFSNLISVLMEIVMCGPKG